RSRCSPTRHGSVAPAIFPRPPEPRGQRCWERFRMCDSTPRLCHRERCACERALLSAREQHPRDRLPRCFGRGRFLTPTRALKSARARLPGFRNDKVSSLFALLLLSSVFLLSCSHHPTPNTLVMVIEFGPTNLDPRVGTDAQSERIDQLIFDSLVH